LNDRNLPLSFDFDNMPLPEPSARVGFARNRIVRDAEKRNEESLKSALADPACLCFLFVPDKAVFATGEPSQVLFGVAEARALRADFSRAILLGHDGGAPRVAVPLDLEETALSEPLKAHDMRSVLYRDFVGDAEAAAIAQASSLLTWHATNRFCGKCGQPTRIAIGGYRLDCSSCGRQSFPRTDPAVIMLTLRGDKALMGRSPRFPPGWFSTLAGFVEPGETIEDAVRRETFEESGIRIGKVAYHASQPWPFPHSLMIGAYAQGLNDDIVADTAELEDCRWFSRDEVRSMIAGTHPEGLKCPPGKSISHSLIATWALAD